MTFRIAKRILAFTLTFILEISVFAQFPTQYPLYLNADRLAAIQNARQKSGSHHAEAFAAMKWRVDQGDLTVYGDNVNRYNRSYLAQEAAFLSLLTIDTSEKAEYAQLAYATIRDIYEDPDQERHPHEDYGLSRAMMGLGLAMPYTWVRHHWSEEQREYVRAKMIQALDAWLTYDHANFWDEKGSNWVAVCRGGELVLLLAAEVKNHRRDRYDFLVEQLLTHMQNGYGDLGVTQEGLGYLEYGGAFLLKAVYAAASKGDSSLFRQAEQHAWWKQTMYTHNFQPHDRKFLMTGVAGSGGYDEGWASLLLNLTPSQDLPYFLWWYDRHLGQLASGGPQQKFDSQRAGTIWSLLYYPMDVSSKDPTGVYPAGVADDHGYYFFRNRWQDANDIQVSVMADEHHHGHAWDQPEVFALNLMGYNTRFVGGPGKERADSLYSTLLVDGAYNIENSVRMPGETVEFQTGDTSASVMVDGGELYENLGVSYARRHVSVKFLPGNEAIIVVMDSLRSEKEHLYTWQLNIGDEEDADSIQMDIENTGGTPQFILRGNNGGKVRGWIISPENVDISRSADPLRVETRGSAARIAVILHISERGDVQLESSGTGSQRRYRIGSETVFIQDNRIHIHK
jgi:hypothetical protein